MNTIQKLNHWADTHNSVWIDFIRFALGIFILIKGIIFATDLEALNTIVMKSKFDFVAAGLVHYVVFAHLVGGLLIAIGLVTRVAVLFQLPILLGAVIFINADKGFFAVNSELSVSVVVLALLIFFLFYGSGKYSIDEYMRTHKFY